MELEKALLQYVLRLGDNALIIGQRLSEECGHGPILEEDLAIANFSLDFIGQATALLGYAGTIEGNGRNEDQLAFQRNEREFVNALLTEQPNGNFAQLIVRQFLFDAYQFSHYRLLAKSKDEMIAALSVKFLKEIDYHLRHSSQWVLRLGDGTQESRDKVKSALDELWKFTKDLFAETEADQLLIENGIAPQQAEVYNSWLEVVSKTITEATLTLPTSGFMRHGSREGIHTEHMGYLLAEMQYLPRIYPDAAW